MISVANQLERTEEPRALIRRSLREVPAFPFQMRNVSIFVGSDTSAEIVVRNHRSVFKQEANGSVMKVELFVLAVYHPMPSYYTTPHT